MQEFNPEMARIPRVFREVELMSPENDLSQRVNEYSNIKPNDVLRSYLLTPSEAESLKAIGATSLACLYRELNETIESLPLCDLKLGVACTGLRLFKTNRQYIGLNIESDQFEQERSSITDVIKSVVGELPKTPFSKFRQSITYGKILLGDRCDDKFNILNDLEEVKPEGFVLGKIIVR